MQAGIISAQASNGAQGCQHNPEMTHPSSAPHITIDNYYVAHLPTEKRKRQNNQQQNLSFEMLKSIGTAERPPVSHSGFHTY